MHCWSLSLVRKSERGIPHSYGAENQMHGNTSWSLHAYEILVPLPKILKVRFCHPTTQPLFPSLEDFHFFSFTENLGEWSFTQKALLGMSQNSFWSRKILKLLGQFKVLGSLYCVMQVWYCVMWCSDWKSCVFNYITLRTITSLRVFPKLEDFIGTLLFSFLWVRVPVAPRQSDGSRGIQEIKIKMVGNAMMQAPKRWHKCICKSEGYTSTRLHPVLHVFQ